MKVFCHLSKRSAFKGSEEEACHIHITILRDLGTSRVPQKRRLVDKESSSHCAGGKAGGRRRRMRREEVFITRGNWRGKKEVFITSGNWRGREVYYQRRALKEGGGRVSA